MENRKIAVREKANMGKGLFAIEDIKKGEIIADWEGGEIYESESANKLPSKEIADHAIQFEQNKWIDTEGIGRFSNHSCNPNCGIRGKFKVVAMKNIKKGEWLTWDYEMTEDSDWILHCKCGEKSCRKIIGAFRNMPEEIRKKYRGYISDWLVEKYLIQS